MTADPAPAEFDPSDYPRRYRASAGWLIYGVLLSVSVGAMAIAGAWYFGTGHEMHGPGQAIAFSAGCTVLALCCAFNMADTLMFAVVLDAQAVEVRRAWGKRRLRRDEIVDSQIVTTQGCQGLCPKTLVLLPLRQEQKALKVPWVVRPDPPFLRWLASLSGPALKTSIRTEAQP